MELQLVGGVLRPRVKRVKHLVGGQLRHHLLRLNPQDGVIQHPPAALKGLPRYGVEIATLAVVLHQDSEEPTDVVGSTGTTTMGMAAVRTMAEDLTETATTAAVVNEDSTTGTPPNLRQEEVRVKRRMVTAVEEEAEEEAEEVAASVAAVFEVVEVVVTEVEVTTTPTRVQGILGDLLLLLLHLQPPLDGVEDQQSQPRQPLRLPAGEQ